MLNAYCALHSVSTYLLFQVCTHCQNLLSLKLMLISVLYCMTSTSHYHVYCIYWCKICWPFDQYVRLLASELAVCDMWHKHKQWSCQCWTLWICCALSVGQTDASRPMENRILKHRSCKQPEGVGCQFGASGTISGSSSGSKLTLNNNKINN